MTPGGDQGHELAELPVSLAHVSIHCIACFGADLAPMRGEFPADVDEEEFARVTLPLLLGRVNGISGQAIVAHFAFHPQREHLDATDRLAQYTALAPQLTLPPAR